MIQEIITEAALKLSIPIIDVRSPSEFAQGHIPHAKNISLFSDEERATVGTLYTQVSREAAISKGYEFVSPKLDNFIYEAKNLATEGEVIVHCWRGGMRSESFAKLLADNGFTKVYRITGGYKAYRKHVLDQLGTPTQLIVLGGYTGSGKTYILKALQELGKQVIDLEGLAHHKGSAFGGIGMGTQPSVEQFENELHLQWSKLNIEKPIWIEDESHGIGSVKIPMPFFSQMRAARVFFVDIPKEERARHLATEYGNKNNKHIAESIHRIAKRLGGLNVRNALALLDEEKYEEVAKIALYYYDKSYINGMNNRKDLKVTTIKLPSTNHRQNARVVEKQIEAYV